MDGETWISLEDALAKVLADRAMRPEEEEKAGRRLERDAPAGDGRGEVAVERGPLRRRGPEEEAMRRALTIHPARNRGRTRGGRLPEPDDAQGR